MAGDFTAKFKVDISDLKKNISEANKQIKLANATFKAETAGMQDWTKDADGLSKKLDQLKSVLSNQKSILESYKGELERNSKAAQENETRADQLRAKLKELADNGVSKADEEYKKYESALKDVIKEQEKNEKSVDDLKIKVLNQQAAVGKTQASIEKYTQAEKDLGTESKETAKDVEKVDTSIKKTADTANKSQGKFSALGKTLTKGLAVAFAAVATAATASVTALVKASTSAAKYADEINTISSKTGMSTKELQSYKYIADLVDVSLETLTGSMAKNIKSMSSAASGTKKYKEAYEKLGVSVVDSNGKLRDSKTVYWETIDALGKIKDRTERDAVAMQLFGKSAQDLNPLIQKGSEGIAALTKEAEKMGVVLSQDQLDKLNELDDSMKRLKGGASAAKNALGLILMPQLKELSDEGIKLVGKFTKSILDANGDWNKIGKAIEKTVGSVSSSILKKLPKFLELGRSIVTGIGGSIVKAAPKISETAVSILSSLVNSLVSALPQMAAAASGIIKNLITGLKSALPTLLSKITEALPQIINTLVDLASFIIKNVDKILVPIVKALPGIITSIVSALTDEKNVNSIIDGIISLLGSVIEQLPTILKSLLDSIPTIIEKVNGALTKALPKIISGLIDLVGKIVKQIPTIIDSLIKALPGIVKSIFDPDTGLLSQKNINAFISGAISIITEIVKNIPEIISSLIKALPTIIDSIFSTDDGLLSGTNIDKLINGAVKMVEELSNPSNTLKIIKSIIDALPGIIASICKGLIDNAGQLVKVGEQLGWKLVEGIQKNDALSNIIGFLISPVAWGVAKIGGIGKHAKGGVFNRPTLGWIGEDGAEAVMPLEKNTGWITLLAHKLASIGSGFNGLGNSQTVNSTRQFNFTQNNYSPKSLSALEIYRLTHNAVNLYSKGW